MTQDICLGTERAEENNDHEYAFSVYSSAECENIASERTKTEKIREPFKKALKKVLKQRK